MKPNPQPVAAVIAVLIREGRVLLVRRANPPDAGVWGFPGGRIEPGETIHAAALRELREETGIDARALEVLTALDVIDRDEGGALRRQFVLVAVLCEWIAGEAVAADDASEAGWFAVDALRGAALPMSRDVDTVALRAARRLAELERKR